MFVDNRKTNAARRHRTSTVNETATRILFESEKLTANQKMAHSNALKGKTKDQRRKIGKVRNAKSAEITEMARKWVSG